MSHKVPGRLRRGGACVEFKPESGLKGPLLALSVIVDRLEITMVTLRQQITKAESVLQEIVVTHQ